ncbi:hypothetical protein Shyhy01_52530 [Streptomyces hygroscopicus subsp. hygroscopicus]|nr:hypothetical protein Shyhy01_52530 [Streptomyces hygroscopicus subsp. hygroscopicus]
MVVSIAQEWGKNVFLGMIPPCLRHVLFLFRLFGWPRTRMGCLPRAADGGPAPFGPTWDPLAADRPKAVVY